MATPTSCLPHSYPFVPGTDWSAYLRVVTVAGAAAPNLWDVDPWGFWFKHKAQQTFSVKSPIVNFRFCGPRSKMENTT